MKGVDATSDHLTPPRETLDEKMAATIGLMTKNGHMNGHH